MKYQRQVARALDPDIPYDSNLKMEAVRQIRSAWVLHIDAMNDFLKRTVKRLVQFRCGICGHRHLYHPYQNRQSPERYHYMGWGFMRCDYGWWFTLTTIIKGAKFHLFHGVDG